MPRVIINGTLSQVKRPTEVDFDPVRGVVYTEEFHSAGDNLGGMANLYYNNRVAYRWKRSPIMSTITATYSGAQAGMPDAPQINWQLLGNEIQKGIFESALALNGIAAGAAATPAWNVVADVKQGFAFIENGDSASEADLFASLPAEEQSFYSSLIGFLMRGQTHFAQGQYVLKRSYSVSNFYEQALPGEGNVEKLILMGDIIGLGMPPVMVNKLNSIPIPASHSGYLWSWRQLPSTMTTQAQNRVEVSTEWWFEEWSTTLYPLA